MQMDEERDQAEINALLRALDDPAPPLNIDAIVARARRDRFAWERWAAGVVIALGTAGVVYALPGSPVREWVDDRFGQTPAVAVPDVPPPTGGISVSADQPLVVVFAAPQQTGAITVSIADVRELKITTAGAQTPPYSSGQGRVLIENQDWLADFDVVIPRGAPRVEIRIGERVALLKAAEVVSTSARADAHGKYVIPLK